jgi:cyanophycin synthetase
MKIGKVRALRGPNRWGRFCAVEAEVSLEGEEDSGEKVHLALLPHIPSLSRFGIPASVAEGICHVALALQIEAGSHVNNGCANFVKEEGIWLVVTEYEAEGAGKEAVSSAFDLVAGVLQGKEPDVRPMIEKVRAVFLDEKFGPSTGSIVEAAKRRMIPHIRLNEGSLVQLGYGAKQKRIWASETFRTSAVGEAIAQDKELTKRLCFAVGVPVPEGFVVKSREEAWEKAQALGCDVVVKPRYGNQGKGVSVGVRGAEEVMMAYDLASKFGEEVIVERQVIGNDYRLLVVGKEVVAAAMRVPPTVIGDGVRTVKELVEELNSDPRRSDGHATVLSKVKLDDVAVVTLAKQGLTIDSVPQKGQKVLLRNNANLSTGGMAVDVTDVVHEETRRLAVLAAQVIGLDVCGIDVVCKDIARPLGEQGGALLEVNAAPGLRMHLEPAIGTPRPVGEAIVSTLFAPDDNGRIPLVAVTGTNGKTTTVRLIAHFLALCGKRVGMTCSDGVYVGGKRIEAGDCSGPKSARRILMNPMVEAAVLECARGGIVREGLGFDYCDVGVVTNIGRGDHLGMAHIHTVEEIARVKRVVVEAVAPWGFAVLNADDPLSAEMAGHCKGKVIFFSFSKENKFVQDAIGRGDIAIFVAHDTIVAKRGNVELVFPLEHIPIALGGRVPFEMQNVMSAIGAGIALGIEPSILMQGLASFRPDASIVPGRFNVFDYNGATVIADYGHNPDAIEALVQAVNHLPARKRVVVISGAGDRRDEDLRKQTEILSEVFDEVVLYEDKCNRGRPEGEVVNIMKQGLLSRQWKGRLVEVKGEFKAIEEGLERLEPGDFGLILVDQVEDSLMFIQNKVWGNSSALSKKVA